MANCIKSVQFASLVSRLASTRRLRWLLLGGQEAPELETVARCLVDVFEPIST